MAKKSPKTDEQRDIKQLESHISLLLSEQRGLNRRTASLQRRILRLEELNRLKDEFIAVASHQLRTPATGVKQYIDLLIEGYADPISDNQKVFLKKAEESNNRQLRIIDDLLQVARLDSESFRLTFTKVEVGEVINKVIDEMSQKTKKRRQSIFFLRPRRKIYVKGDPEKLPMIFENLIDNASNYSLEDTTIEIRLRTSKEKVIVDIKDHGVGIGRQDFHRLFQKFSRIPNPRSVEVGGTGLGLYWAHRIAELHSGVIKVRSKPESGSTFTVVLPLYN